jgi:hypothetical protein
MENEKTVNARYIIYSGTSFDSEAPWPHQNYVTLEWKRENKEDEDVVIEFIFVGSHDNRSIYHELSMEEAPLC